MGDEVPDQAPDSEPRARIEDVATAAGVSIMSVSRAMRGVDGVSEAKRLAILRIARDIGYAPNRLASTLAASGSNLIGVSFPILFGSVFSEIFAGLRSRLSEKGLQTVLDTTEYDLAARRPALAG